MKKTKIQVPDIVQDVQERITKARADIEDFRTQQRVVREHREEITCKIGRGDFSTEAMKELSDVESNLLVLDAEITRREGFLTEFEWSWRSRPEISKEVAEALIPVIEQRAERLRTAKEVYADSARALILTGTDPEFVDSHYLPHVPEIPAYVVSRSAFRDAQFAHDLAVQYRSQSLQLAAGQNVNLSLDTCLSMIREEIA